MSVTFTGRLTVQFTFNYPNTADLGNVAATTYSDYLRFMTEFLTSGSGDDQCNAMWIDRRTLTLASPTDQLDLAGGLTDMYGNTLTFSEIKVLVVHNRGVLSGSTVTPTHGEDLLIGGGGGNAWASLFNGDQSAVLRLRSDGKVGLCAPYDGYSVSPGTEDILLITHDGSAASGGDISYDIGIAGVI